MSLAPVDRDQILAVGLDEPHVDALGDGARQVLADEVGADRQLAVPAVDQHGQAHGARAGRGRSARRGRRGCVRPE